MVKRIIAVCCVLVMTVLIFAACEKKPPMEEINGIEKAVAYDEEGQTVLNSSGQLRVYSLDEKGYIQYEEDGTPVYNYVDLPAIRANGQTVDTNDYSLTMPEGWEATESGGFFKKEAEKCRVNMGYVKDLQTETLDSVVQEEVIKSQEVEDEMQKNAPDYQIDKGTDEFQLCGKRALSTWHLVKDPSGNVVHYAVTVYYENQGKLYLVSYGCIDGQGYDPDFDFVAYLKENFVIK